MEERRVLHRPVTMKTKRLSVTIAGLTATALLLAAPCLASPNKKKQEPQVYLQVKLETVYISSVASN